MIDNDLLVKFKEIKRLFSLINELIILMHIKAKCDFKYYLLW